MGNWVVYRFHEAEAGQKTAPEPMARALSQPENWLLKTVD